MAAENKDKNKFSMDKMLPPMLAVMMVATVANVMVAPSSNNNGGGITTYDCPYCHLPFNSQAELAAHITTAHPTERTPIDITW